MFRNPHEGAGRPPRFVIIGLVTLSVAALAVTVWTMFDFLREQVIVQELITKLPDESLASAEELAGELRWQFRLTILVVLNLIVTGFAVVLLWRAYGSSQRSLRDIKALAGDILSSIDQAVVTTDIHGHLTSINRSGMELFGVGEEVVGAPLSELTAKVELDLSRLRDEVVANPRPTISRDYALSSTDVTKNYRAFVQPLSDWESDPIGHVFEVRDVTESVLIEQRMRRMERYMGLGSLAAGLHHEIKNPLAALSLHVQLLEEELTAFGVSDNVSETVAVIQAEMARVGAVLEGFRDYASLGSLSKTRVDLEQMIQQQFRLLEPRAKLQGVTLEFTGFRGLRPVLNADPVRIEQVLVNLLVNSLDAMPKGGLLKVTFQCYQDLSPPSVKIIVQDTGPGIPETLRHRIFDPYFTTKREGTGMGLALCDKIISQHNGAIEYQRQNDETTFEITLPTEFF